MNRGRYQQRNRGYMRGAQALLYSERRRVASATAPTLRSGLSRSAFQRLTGLAIILLTGLASILLTGCTRPVTIDAPPPHATGDFLPPAIAPLAESVVDAPISLSLGPTLEAMERAVPVTFGDLNERVINPSNRRQSFAYEATRTRFDVTLDEGLLTLGTTVHYAGKGANPLGIIAATH